MPDPARFALLDDARDLRLGVFQTLDGFFTGHVPTESYFAFVDESGWFPMEFTVGGLRPDEPLPVGERLGWCWLEILSDAGQTIGLYEVAAAEVTSLLPRPDGSFDATVTGRTGKPPESGAEAIWDAWRGGPPSVAGTWASLPSGSREAWLDVAANYRPGDRLRRGVRHDGSVVLDGRHTTDLTSVWCALGEAVNGPGGYFGSNPYALADCLGGGWGADAPFTLVWQSFAVAREHVDEAVLAMVLGPLAEAGVVVLES